MILVLVQTLLVEDLSSEKSVSTTSPTYARTLCSYSCSTDFYGVRRNTNSQFKCRCFDRDSGVLVGQDHLNHDPKKKPDCDVAAKVYQDLFAADSSLNSFITESSLSLTTTDGQVEDPSGRPNLCIDSDLSRINIAPLYLAKALGLSVSNLINNYVYDTNVSSHVYPNSSQTIYPPTQADLTDFPLLDQAYWTIVLQYTPYSERNLRKDKSTHWCWWVGQGLMWHCKEAKKDICNNILCNDIHKPMLETCHRVRGLDTSTSSDYKYHPATKKWCLNTLYSNGGYADITLYEVSRE